MLRIDDIHAFRRDLDATVQTQTKSGEIIFFIATSQKNKTDLVSVLFFCLKKWGLNSIRDGYSARASKKKRLSIVFS